MQFDKQYRELQAEYSFSWGTFAAQLEMKTLVLKQANAASERSVFNTPEECRMYKARGWCSFGGNCKYRHVQMRRNDAIGYKEEEIGPLRSAAQHDQCEKTDKGGTAAGGRGISVQSMVLPPIETK
jgi:hypothetical protein